MSGYVDPTRIEHSWELKTKVWVCRNCKAEAHPTAKQLESNSFGKPSRKRRIDGLYCGERIVSTIHES